MKILLLKPRWFVRGGQYRYLEVVRFTPLSLGILAALSDGHDVTIVDGDWDPIPFDESFDLVGITVTTFTSERAYALARRFKKNGARVVLGGVHPSLLPDECLAHADAVAIGEAESLWKQILSDAQGPGLKRVYRADRPPDLDDVPVPRRDLLADSSWFACLQTTRGCTHACRYCYLPSVPWGVFRKRTLEKVAEEIAQIPQKLVYIVDDNLFADRDYALRIFRSLAPFKKTWSIQVPTTLGKDESMLDAMAEAGVFNVQVGVQRFNRNALSQASVTHNRVEAYQTLVDRFHERNILVTGFFMFGFDADGPDIFDGTVAMIKRLDLDDANLYVLTPYPGTALYRQLEREDRLLSGTRRTQFGWAHAVFQPKRMSPRELETGVQRAYDRLYPHFQRRLPKELLKRLPLLLRHPKLAGAILRGGIRRARVRREPA
ncbi:MAG: B12-binding domain-containing radical SAM protein [Planctomycetota bacterium]